MAAAYLLSPSSHVTLYEKNAIPGGHARTILVPGKDGTTTAVDTGFIVFNHVNYPELLGLFRHLGVATETSNMTFAFSTNGGAFEWGAKNLNAVFGQRSNLLKPYFYRMIWDVLRFFKHAPECLDEQAELSLGQLLDRLALGKRFREQFILPMGAAIWSCPMEKMLEFPAKTFVRFFKNHGLLSLSGQHQWYTVTGGSQEYVKKITAPLAGNIRLNSPVAKVWRDGGQAVVRTADGDEERYDHVVFASHADETMSMLADATPEETSILSTFHYQPNHAFLHRDPRQMPKRTACWASWNYLTDNRNRHQLSLTYWMNSLQNLDPATPLFVTLNPMAPIVPELIIDQHIFTHPIFTREAIAAQARIPEIQGKRNFWFCGAWQRYGFHEDGIMSAVAVAKQMGASIPWH